MLCYVMLCYAMLCYAMLCDAMRCVGCNAMHVFVIKKSFHVVLSAVVSCGCGFGVFVTVCRCSQAEGLKAALEAASVG